MAIWGQGISLRGPRGEDGSKIYFITGTPTDENASAIEGSVAFDTDSQMLYQRGAEGWPAEGTLLRGATGLTGVNGASFISGPGTPDGTVTGADGDLFLALDTGEIFKHVDGAWADQSYSIKGPVGSVGPVGPAGEAGIRGTQVYTAVGEPPADLATLNPPAQAGDIFYNVDPSNPEAPVMYVLGA